MSGLVKFRMSLSDQKNKRKRLFVNGRIWHVIAKNLENNCFFQARDIREVRTVK